MILNQAAGLLFYKRKASSQGRDQSIKRTDISSYHLIHRIISLSLKPIYPQCPISTNPTMNLKSLSYQKKDGVLRQNRPYPTYHRICRKMPCFLSMVHTMTYRTKAKKCECECVYQSKSFEAAPSNSDAGSMLMKCDDLGI
jgi:hypothetical protein